MAKTAWRSASLSSDFTSDRLKWKDPVDAAELDGFLGHAEDDAARLVLRDGARARLVHLEEAASAVVAHPRHDDAERILAGVLRHREEERVHRPAVAVDERAVADFDVVLGAASLEEHVPAAGRKQRATGEDAVAVRGFANLDLAHLVQSCGECGREFLRHVLHHHDARGYA